MHSAPLTPDETNRLAKLWQYQVLDSAAEKVFDDLTQLAADICDTPIALISLVDTERQWFKAKIGIDACETHRDLAFCAHAIHGRQVFEVPDATQDERFADNPLVTQDPNIRFYAGAPLVSPDGFAIGTLCTIDRVPKKLTEKQRRALSILAHEVISQLELRQKVHELEHSNANKSAFISRISHELRTPLNAIVGFSSLLLKKQTDLALPEKVIKHLQHIAFSGKKLGELINSVLDLAKIEAGKMELHTAPVNLPELISNIAGMLKGGADEKGVIFTLHMAKDLPQWVSSDETKLGQVLINILSNAIKFTPKGKQVSLQVSCDKQHLTFSVQDEGIGISAENLKRLFIPFEQADNSISRQFGGTGLGLAISKQLTGLLQGKLVVHSQLGKGSVFTLQLPLVNSSAPLQTEVTQHVLTGTVLVVEDNNINQEVINAMLEDTQLNVIYADDGEEAIALFGSIGADLILMDIHLPGIDGYETARRIRAFNTQVPIIALSADVLNETTAKQQQLFVSCLTKPVNQELLLKALHTHLPA